jgi:hypothetical protein
MKLLSQLPSLTNLLIMHHGKQLHQYDQYEPFHEHSFEQFIQNRNLYLLVLQPDWMEYRYETVQCGPATFITICQQSFNLVILRLHLFQLNDEMLEAVSTCSLLQQLELSFIGPHHKMKYWRGERSNIAPSNKGYASLSKLSLLSLLTLVGWQPQVTGDAIRSISTLSNLYRLSIVGACSLLDSDLVPLCSLRSLASLNVSYCSLLTASCVSSLCAHVSGSPF